MPGYSGEVEWAMLAAIIPRLILALYLLASALSQFDRDKMARWEVFARLALAVLVLTYAPLVYGPAIIAAIGLIAFHTLRSSQTKAKA